VTTIIAMTVRLKHRPATGFKRHRTTQTLPSKALSHNLILYFSWES